MAVEPGFELWAGLEELPKSHTLEPIPMSKPTTKSAATAQSSSLELLPAFAGSSLPKGDADATPAGMSSSSASTAPPRSATAKADSTGYRGVVHRVRTHACTRLPPVLTCATDQCARAHTHTHTHTRGASMRPRVLAVPDRRSNASRHGTSRWLSALHWSSLTCSSPVPRCCMCVLIAASSQALLCAHQPQCCASASGQLPHGAGGSGQV